MRSRDLAEVAAALLLAGWRVLDSSVPPWRDWTVVACACWAVLGLTPSARVRAWVTVAASAYLLVVYRKRPAAADVCCAHEAAQPVSVRRARRADGAVFTGQIGVFIACPNAAGHGGRLERDDLVEAAGGDHHPAGVLADVWREAEHLADDLQARS